MSSNTEEPVLLTKEDQLVTAQPGTAASLKEVGDLIGSGHMVFRLLDSEEEDVFRQSARSNYRPYDDILGIWHPVYQQECVTINHELSFYQRGVPSEDNDSTPEA